MEGNLLEIAENMALKGYGDVCDGKGDFKENMQLTESGIKNSIALMAAEKEDAKKDLEIELLQLQRDREMFLLKKLEDDQKRQKFVDIRDTAFEVLKIIVPIGTGILTIGGGFGLAAYKHYCLKDTISYNGRIQDSGGLGINESKFMDIPMNDFKKI